MLRIEHVAIWTQDLEAAKDFYTRYFKMKSGEKYVNPGKRFSSYFLSFEDTSSCRIELMHKSGIAENNEVRGLVSGYAHLAVSVGSKEEVDRLTEQLRADGYKIAGEPRFTGDGYYESIVEDSDGNWVEITI